MSDPVANKSAFLCMYMSNHPDTLVLYAKHWGKSTEAITHAQMTAIDTKGMTLFCQTRDGGERKIAIRVSFDPPLAGYEEVKPRLLAMKVDAEQALGMTRNPQITTFTSPSNLCLRLAFIGFLPYTLCAPFAPPNLPVGPGRALNALLGGPRVVTGICGFIFTVHALESLYVLSLCRRHRTPFVVGCQYVFATLALGFSGLNPLKKRIQEARVESIMKGE